MKKIIAIVIVLILAGFGYYTLSPLFITIHVEDAMPTTSSTSVRGPFSIQGTTAHPASGEVKIVQDSTGTLIRFENFETINGPNLHVYLAKSKDPKEFIDLGPIRGTEGNINYPVPEGTDLSEYPIVMHWCVPFKVLFNYAEIQ